MTRTEQALSILRKGTVIPATPLALNADRSFYEKGQRLLMRYYLDCGVGGIATAVHTTQFEIRQPEIALLEPVLRIVSEEIDRYEERTGKTIVRIAGCCGPTEQAVEEAKLARSYGFDAVLLSPGGLNHQSEAYMIERTKAVAAEMPVIGFYLQEAVGGRVFTYDYWKQIAEIDHVVAIKCASFDRYTTLDVVRAVATSSRWQDIALYTGNDDNIVVDLLTKYRFPMEDGSVREISFCGGLLGHWTMWSKAVAELFSKLCAAKSCDMLDASLLSLAAQITDANAVFFDSAHKFAGCIPGVHEVLRRQGLMERIWCLNPEETLSPGQSEEIDRIYRMYPHLNDDAFVRAHLEQWKQDL